MLGNSEVCATLPVKDLDEAKKYYGETLGLQKESENPGGVLYKSGNSKLFVYPSEFAGTNKATAAAWAVDDVEATAQALSGKGISLEHYDNLPGVTREGDVHVMGPLKAIWFIDPSGNILNVTNGAM